MHFWSAYYTAFTPLEYVTFSLKFGITHDLYGGVKSTLIGVFHSALEAGEEMWCRDFARELTNRNLPYKYEWLTCDPLTLWESSS